MRKVVLEHPGLVRIIESDPTGAVPGQALVRLRAAGICGSDLSAYRGTSALVTYPRVLGHEILVDVLECHGDPTLNGHRAVVDPMRPCHRCHACRAGRYNCCAHLQVMGVHVDGGLQDSMNIEYLHLFAVPDSMSDEVAVLAEPLTIAYHAVKRSRIEAGQIAVVFGAGTIGLLIAQLLLRARGCRVIVIDRDPHRLRIAESLGATPLHAENETMRSGVARQTGPDLADVVFEASGSPIATGLTTELVAHAGRIVLVGWNMGAVPVDTVALMRKEVDLLGSRNSLNAFPAVLRLLADGIIDPDMLVTHRFGLEDTGKALDLLDKGTTGALKVLIEAE